MAAETGATTDLIPSPVALSSAVDQVVVSGVVQVGQQVHAIITEPGNPSGRRVSQGDTVAGGQVRIKAIDLSSPDPTVVLTYNGRDYYRTVGGAGLL
jgi:type II secretory pathway component PulC